MHSPYSPANQSLYDADLQSVVSAVHNRCYFPRDDVINVDVSTTFVDFRQSLSYLEHSRVVGLSSHFSFDIHVSCAGVKILNLSGYSSDAVLRAFYNLVTGIVDGNLFESVLVTRSTCAASGDTSLTAVCNGFEDVTTVHDDCAASMRVCPSRVRDKTLYVSSSNCRASSTARWIQEPVGQSAPSQFYVFFRSTSVDLRVYILDFVEVLMRPFIADSLPVIVRYYDCTEEEAGFADLLVEVGRKPKSKAWSLQTSKLARLTLMDDCIMWTAAFVRTDLADALEVSSFYLHRLFWDGFSTSLGFSEDSVSLSRLAAFKNVEIDKLLQNLQKFLKLHKHQHLVSWNLAACSDFATLTLDFSELGMFGGVDASAVKLKSIARSISLKTLLVFLDVCGKDLRFIVLYFPGMDRRVRSDFARLVTLPVISSCRDRLYAFLPLMRDKSVQRDVIIDLKPAAGKRSGPSSFEQLLLASKRKSS